MNYRPLLLLTSIFFVITFSSCDKENDVDDTALPNAVFNATVSGAINQVISITLEENVTETESVNGSFSSTTDQFAMAAINLTGAWQFGMFYNSDTFEVGTYDVLNISGFTNPSQVSAGFAATSGTITISKAELFQGVGAGLGAADDYFIDGSFTMTMESSETPPQQIQVSGTFTGINIKAN